jgi:hypothetical protein
MSSELLKASPPSALFRHLWTRSVVVCVAVGGSIGTLAVLGPMVAQDAVETVLKGPWQLALFGIGLSFVVLYGMALSLPISVLGGTLAAGLLWWLRDHWSPQDRISWILIGTLFGLSVATGLAISVFGIMFRRYPSVLPLSPAAALAGGICGAIIGWLEPVDRKRTVR